MSRLVVRRWHRALLPSGEIWCESSDPGDFRAGGIGSLGPAGPDGKPLPLTFQRFEVFEEAGPWEEWTP